MTGLDLPPMLVFDYPTGDALADFIVSVMPPRTVLKPSAKPSAGAADMADANGAYEPSEASAGPVWLHMDAPARAHWAASAVAAAVVKIVGAPVGEQEPLLNAGVDSLGKCKPLHQGVPTSLC